MDRAPPGIRSWPQGDSNVGPRFRRQQNQRPKQQQQQYEDQSAMDSFQQLRIQLCELQFQQQLVQQQHLQQQQQQQQDMQQLIVQQYSHFLHQMQQQQQQLPRLMRGLLDFRFDRIVQVTQAVKWDLKRDQSQILSQMERVVNKALHESVNPGLFALNNQAKQGEVLSTSIMSRLATLETKVDAIACALNVDHQKSGQQQQRQDHESSVTEQILMSPRPQREQAENQQVSSKLNKSNMIFSRLLDCQKRDHEKKNEDVDKDAGVGVHQGIEESNPTPTVDIKYQNGGCEMKCSPEEKVVESEFTEENDEETVPKQLYDDPICDFEQVLNELAPSPLAMSDKTKTSDVKLPNQQGQQNHEQTVSRDKNRERNVTRRYEHKDSGQPVSEISESSPSEKVLGLITVNKIDSTEATREDINQQAQFTFDMVENANESNKKPLYQQNKQKYRSLQSKKKSGGPVSNQKLQKMQKCGYEIPQTTTIMKQKSPFNLNKNEVGSSEQLASKANYISKNSLSKEIEMKTSKTLGSPWIQSKTASNDHDLMRNQNQQKEETKFPTMEAVRDHTGGTKSNTTTTRDFVGTTEGVQDQGCSKQANNKKSENSHVLQTNRNHEGNVEQTSSLAETSSNSKSQQLKTIIECTTSGLSLTDQTQTPRDDDRDAACVKTASRDLTVDEIEVRGTNKLRCVNGVEKYATISAPRVPEEQGRIINGGQKGADYDHEKKQASKECQDTNPDQRLQDFSKDSPMTTGTALSNKHRPYTFDLNIHDTSKYINRPGNEISSEVCHVKALHGKGSVWFISKDLLQVWFTICKTDMRSGRHHSEGDGDTLWHSTHPVVMKEKIHRLPSDENGDVLSKPDSTKSKAIVKATLIDPAGKLPDMSVGQGSVVQWDAGKGSGRTYRLGALSFNVLKKAGFTIGSNSIVLRFSIEMGV